MYCTYCKERLEAQDEVVTFSGNEDIVHEDCLYDYTHEKFVDKAQTYLELLEERVL